MPDELGYLFIGLLVLVLASFVRPTSARCPAGFYVEGVRPSGVTRCVPVDTSGPDCAGSYRCPNTPPARYDLPIQIYCTGGSIPIAGDDGRTVGCTRRFGS